MKLVLALIGLLCSAALAQQPPLPVRVASLDQGQVLAGNAPEVRRASQALSDAAAVCQQSATQLADAAHVGVLEAAKIDVLVSRVELLEMASAVAAPVRSPKEPKSDCNTVIAQYLTMRRNGKENHARTVTSFRALVVAVAAAR
jgi:hypothetical protein